MKIQSKLYRNIQNIPDGIEVIIPKEDEYKYAIVLKEVEKQFNLELEHENYQSITYANVN